MHPETLQQGTPLAPVTTLPPKIIHQTAPVDGLVRVTYALPGLQRATVSVPEGRWLVGGHLPVGKALTDLLTRLAPTSAAEGATLSGLGEGDS